MGFQLPDPNAFRPLMAYMQGQSAGQEREMNAMRLQQMDRENKMLIDEPARKTADDFYANVPKILASVPRERRQSVLDGMVQNVKARGGDMRFIRPESLVLTEEQHALFDAMQPPPENRIGTASPSDFSPASLGEYQRTGDPSVLERVYPPQRQQMPQQEEWGKTPFVGADGNTYVLSNLGNVRQVQAPGQPAPSGAAPGQPAAPGGPLLPPSQNPDVQADKIRAGEDAKLRVKAEADIPRMEGAFRQFSMKSSEVGKSIAKAKKLISPWSTGYGDWVKKMPMTDAKALNGALQSVRARISFDELTAMREASKTGGALGSVTERELDLLQNAVASLDQAQTGEQVKESLDAIEQHYVEATRLYQEMLADRRAYASGQAVIKPQAAPQPAPKLPSGWSIERVD